MCFVLLGEARAVIAGDERNSQSAESLQYHRGPYSHNIVRGMIPARKQSSPSEYLLLLWLFYCLFPGHHQYLWRISSVFTACITSWLGLLAMLPQKEGKIRSHNK